MREDSNALNDENEKFGLLNKLGAGDFQHLNGSLITHLKATRDILNSWGANSVLCDAGLYHAAYGTDGFGDSMVSLNKRADIASVIGKEAEELVYLYCSCDRKYVFPKLGSSERIKFRDRFSGENFALSNKQSASFCELTVANEMELIRASHAFKNKHGEELLQLFKSIQGHLSNNAINSYQQVLVGNS